ncbi:metabotropic glutamate receptor 2-like [Diadema antillarum]|uniref:metabotropic glutamate receptor 2-like n=1 Tax=Diadema antillarum TaxID=105358 RepID=UPI003A8BB968
MATMVYLSRCEGPQPEIVYRRSGDVVLGGLFGLHYTTRNANACRILREFQTLKRVEAMTYAIDRINADETLLPGVNIGFEIYDTCFYDVVALGRSMNFIPDRSGEICSCVNVAESDPIVTPSGECETKYSGVVEDVETMSTCCSGTALVGLVGAERSEASMQAATLMGLYETPQISYLSTSDTLSNKASFPYFLRTVPPDRHQVSVIVDIILHFGWSYVSFLYSDDEYGQSAYDSFREQTQQAGICTAYFEALDEDADAAVYDEIYLQLLSDQYHRAKVVVLFTHAQGARKIFEASLRGPITSAFTWVVSDAVGNIGAEMFQALNLETAAVGMLATVPFSETLEAFEEEFVQLVPDNTDNPWAPEFFGRYIPCALEDLPCREPVVQTPSQETLVMDAVYAFAHAMDTLMREECDDFSEESRKYCLVTRSQNGTRLLSYLKETSFESLANGNFSFTADGNGEGRYAIENYQMTATGDLKAVYVGSWRETREEGKRLVLDGADILFYTDAGWNTTEPPTSFCSEECPPKYARVHVQDTAICCWNCQQCERDEVVANLTECKPCPADSLPDPASGYTMCQQVELVPLLYYSWLGPCLVGVSALGCLIACVVLILLVVNIKDALIQRSEPVLLFIILVGIFLAFAVGLTVIFPPLAPVCTFNRLATSLSYTVIYVPLAIKSVRLFRIFKKAKATDSQEEAHLLSLPSQLTLFAFGVLGQAGISTVWLYMKPTAIVPYPFTVNDDLVIQMACDVFWAEPLTTILYNFSFLLLCCIFSILARHLPDNYHETRFITFSSFGSCILIAAFCVPYITASRAFEGFLYAAILAGVNSMLVLVCVFIIKLYAVIHVTPAVPSMVSSALAGTATSAYKERARTRTTSSTDIRVGSSTTNLLQRPKGKSKASKEVTFSDIRPEANGTSSDNLQTESTRL